VDYKVLDNAEAVADFAAKTIAGVVRLDPMARIALPTGKTPLPMYERLVRMHGSGTPDMSMVQWFALDDFSNVSIPEECTFAWFLRERLIRKAGLPESNLHAPNPKAIDANAEGRRFEDTIRGLGGLTLAVLGIGANGHIAFNEPGTPFGSRTGLRILAGPSRQANAYLFPHCRLDSVPTTAISMGIGTIMEAERVMLIATGAGKAEIMRRLRVELPSQKLPASALLEHPDCIAVMDRAAAAPMPTGTRD